MKTDIRNILFNLRKVSLRDLFLFLIVFVFCLSLDLYSKNIVFRSNFTFWNVCEVLNIIKVENYGISFGLFAGSNFFVKKLIIIFNISICCYLLFLLKIKDEYKKPNLFLVSISMIISGAIGNVFDRIKFGYVRDFIDFHVFNKHWPAFNIADSCICVGVGLWVILEIFKIKTLNK